MFKRATIVLVGCAGLLLASCGGDDDGGDSDNTDAAAGDESNDEGSDDTTAADDDTDDTTAATDTDDTGDDSGDASGDYTEDDYVTAMIASFDSQDSAELAIDREQAECVAPKWIDILGVDRLQENGITPDDIDSENDMELTDLGLSQDEGNAMYDTFGACDVDVAELFIKGLSTDTPLSNEQSECLSAAFDDDLLRTIMVTTLVEGDEALTDDEDVSGAVFAALGECDLLETTDE